VQRDIQKMEDAWAQRPDEAAAVRS
jgi:hypothetical protein